MELNLNATHVFGLIKLVSKLKLKDELTELISRIATANAKYNNVSIKLKFALGDKENNEENMAELLSKNEKLREEVAGVQAEKKSLLTDAAFLFIDKAADGEKEIINFLANCYGVKAKDIEALKPSELVEYVKAIIEDEEMQKAFRSIFK